MKNSKKILLIMIVFLAGTVIFSSCDFQGSLLAPDSRILVDDKPITIVTDEFGAQYAAGQFTVAFQPGTPHSEIREFAQSVGDVIHRFDEALSWVYVRSDRPVDEVEQDWRQPGWSQTAVRDYFLTISGFVDENDSGDQNELQNMSIQIDDPLLDEQWGLIRIRAPEVWDSIGVRGEGVMVGVLDGPWYDPALATPDTSKNVHPFSDNHEDLDGTWNSIKPLISNDKIAERIHQRCENKVSIFYTYGKCWENQIIHATHVGGIISTPINDIGIVGVAPNSRLAPLYATSFMTNEPFSEGIQRLINEDVDIINISMGLSKDKLTSNVVDINEWTEWMSGARKLWFQVFNLAHRENILVVNSAGNDDIDAGIDLFKHLIGVIPNGIVVGSSGGIIFNSDTRSSFSNYGPIVDVYAPGRRILSTVACGVNESCALTGTYEKKSGTSMAAPHVSGVAALIYSLAKERFGERPTPESVKEAIIEGSRNGGVFINNVVNEVPRLDAYEAVRYYLREACPRATGEIAAKVANICPQDLYN